ncbi:MAG: nucleotidyltransferase domain-containing protein [Solirubrobacterales bacterium]
MATIASTTLTEGERRTLELLIELLQRELGSNLLAVWLFGSRARGEVADEESDVDLLVLTSDGSDQDQRRVIDLVFEAADAAGARPTYFSAHVRNPAWVEQRRAIDDFFIRDVDRDKVVLFGSG